MLWRAVTVVLSAAVLAPPASSASAGRVSIFYYPWYGTPAHDGAYRHWQQNGVRVPGEVASAFYPARGLYSSADRLVVAAQLAEIRGAGIDAIVASWWGSGSFEDARLAALQDEAREVGLEVAVHVEPYPGRTPESTREDVEYLRSRGISEVYVYAPQDSAALEWRQVTDVDGMRVLAQTRMAGYAVAGGFDGIYTYDVLMYGGGTFARICAAAARAGLTCAPSVGPGYNARRAVGDERIKLRRGGRTYDSMWRAAIASGADAVTITSYNEWHEGTQIEPARPYVGPDGGRYAGYEGAWGRTGRSAERAYLDRTAFWTSQYRSVASRRR